MPITFRCSDCTQKLRIEDEFAGKKVACVRCGSRQRVPLVSSPEFSQPALEPREPTAPTSPAQPPDESQLAAFEPSRRQTPKPEIPPAPFWFKPVERADIRHSPHEPASPAPQPEEAPAGPTFSHRALPEQTQFAADENLPVEAPEELPEPEVFRPPQPEPVSRRGAARAPHAEKSLVPPYKKLDVEEMIDMTAMVDIVFFLLIFFLVTSMHALDSTIPMPVPDPQKGVAREPKSVAAIDSDDSYVVVRIDRNDKILIEGSEVRSDRELIFKLRDLRLSSAHPDKLLVVGHGDATHGTVVMVLDAGRELGMDQVRLTMQDEPE